MASSKPIPPEVREFADRLNSALNRSITKHRIIVAPVPGANDLFHVRLDPQVDSGLARLSVEGGDDLYLSLLVGVDASCSVREYRYYLYARDDRDSLLLRWEFDREKVKPNYKYVRAHVHFHGTFEHSDKPAEELHIPTSRVSIEELAWHLITDWNVKTIHGGWQAALVESSEKFAKERSDLPPFISVFEED